MTLHRSPEIREKLITDLENIINDVYADFTIINPTIFAEKIISELEKMGWHGVRD